MTNSSIWAIDRTLSGATTPGKSESGSDGNEEIQCIPQSSSITGATSSDCLMHYPGHSLGGGLISLPRCSWCILQPQLTGSQDTHLVGSYPSAEMQSVYSTVPADWAEVLGSIPHMNQINLFKNYSYSIEIIDAIKLLIISIKNCNLKL